ncbi:MAG: polysaccharide lyase family 7 protein [Maribacter sp.]|nr:polysaccharide lyase family 7 protein [Maribacter sp.]
MKYLKRGFKLQLIIVATLCFSQLIVSCSSDDGPEETPEEEVVEEPEVPVEEEGTNAEPDGSEETVDEIFGLSANLEPWENFDLSDWAIDTPAVDEDDGFSQRFGELNWDPLATSDSRPFFFTHTDGGMRFVSTIGGARTSQNTSFTRSELREMLRKGNTSFSTQGANGNNWALGYQPTGTNHAGRNGSLTATLRVNQVTTTGSGLHPGRTVIGQIHASSDEPARLYYRKLPNAEFGCLYLEHEIRDGNDVTFNLIGDEDCSGNGPDDGIKLDELFSYEIVNDNEDIIVRIFRGDTDGPLIAETTVDMNTLNSGYELADEWMYFKAGIYTQNNTGNDDDGDIVTFYRLDNTHDSN